MHQHIPPVLAWSSVPPCLGGCPRYCQTVVATLPNTVVRIVLPAVNALLTCYGLVAIVMGICLALLQVDDGNPGVEDLFLQEVCQAVTTRYPVTYVADSG